VRFTPYVLFIALCTTPPTSEPVAVLAGAGDIGWCGSAGPALTANLLDGIAGAVFTAGDNAYDNATYDDYLQCYEPTWGRHKARTHPVPGNHEYQVSDTAEGYFRYFGSAAGPDTLGYYDYTVGSWYVLGLNSNLYGTAMDAQLAWLSAHLAATPALCTIAVWHHPLFSSGKNGPSPHMRPVWQALAAAGVDVIINGHDHLYERFAPQTADGLLDPIGGIRQFTVGTGGAAPYPVVAIVANSEARITDTFGVLKLTLYDGRYEWEFIDADGILDRGSGMCH
jgi:3',5'-cyclic AMP phosphodiesterase CpdA